MRRYIRIGMQHRPELDRWILQAVGTPTSLLDLGCGVGRNAYLLWEDDVVGLRTGIEVDAGYLEKARQLGLYHGLIRGDLAQDLPARSKSFDVVLCTQVLGLLDKAAGVRLLEECERVAVERVVISVQVGNDLRTRQGSWENDRSIWTPAELRHRGYTVQGFGSGFSRSRHGGRRFLYGFYLGTLLAQTWDRFAEEILCVRELTAPERS